MDVLSDFTKVVPYLTHPLALIGFVLLLFFGVHRTLIGSGIIPPVNPRTGGKIVQALLRFGFAIAVLIIVLGFALQAFKTHRETALTKQAVAALTEEAKAKDKRLSAAWSREQQYLTFMSAFSKLPVEQIQAAIRALSKQTNIANAQPRIAVALRLAAQGDATKAEHIFEEVEKQKALGGEEANKQAAEAARHRGALAFLHDTEESLAAYRRATQLDPDNADGWKQLGRLLTRLGKFQDAKTAFEKLISLGELKGDRESVAWGYIGLGEVYLINREVDRAEASFRNSLAIAEELNWEKGIAYTYQALGLIYQSQGDLDKAEASVRKSITMLDTLDSNEDLAASFLTLGVIYRDRGDLKQAEAWYRKSLTLLETQNDKGGMASCYSKLGELNLLLGDLDGAEENYAKSLAMFKTLRHTGAMALSYIGLGLVYRERGNLDKSENFFFRSLVRFEELDYKPGLASAYAGLCSLYVIGDKLDRSVAICNDALIMSMDLHNKANIATSYNALGIAYQKYGELDQAETMYRKAIALYEELNSPQVDVVRKLLGKLDQLRLNQ